MATQPTPDRRPYFALPEYETIGRRFVQEAVELFMREKNPLYRKIPVRRVEHVLPTRLPLSAGGVFQSTPMFGEVPFTLPGRDLVNGRYRSLLPALEETAELRLRSLMPQIFKNLDQVTEAAGQVVDAGGQPFSYDLLLQLIEKVDITFDPSGQPRMPDIVLHPDLMERVRKMGPPTEEQQAALDALLARKRQDYFARKRYRRLP